MLLAVALGAGLVGWAFAAAGIRGQNDQDGKPAIFHDVTRILLGHWDALIGTDGTNPGYNHTTGPNGGHFLTPVDPNGPTFPDNPANHA